MANMFLVGNRLFIGDVIGGGGGGGGLSSGQLPMQLPYMYVADPEEGIPISGADIYVGEPSLDPEIPANQKTVTGIDESGTEYALTQPINTGAGGIPLYNGSPISLYVDGNYSIKILNSLGVQEYYAPEVATIEAVDLSVLDEYAKLDSPAFIGTPTAPTAGSGDNSTLLATTAFVQGELTTGGYAPLASPTFTGDPQAPTAAPGDNDNSIATTAFVTTAITNSLLFNGALAGYTGATVAVIVPGAMNSANIAGFAESFDVGSYFNLTSGAFTPGVEGYYRFVFEFDGLIRYNLSSPNITIGIRKNSSFEVSKVYSTTAGVDTDIVWTKEITLYMNGTTDSVDFYIDAPTPSVSTVDDVTVTMYLIGAV